MTRLATATSPRNEVVKQEISRAVMRNDFLECFPVRFLVINVLKFKEINKIPSFY